ncbi:MAG: hypothetical protein R3E91_02010 [Chlamydiales bacterium]
MANQVTNEELVTLFLGEGDVLNQLTYRQEQEKALVEKINLLALQTQKESVLDIMFNQKLDIRIMGKFKNTGVSYQPKKEGIEVWLACKYKREVLGANLTSSSIAQAVNGLFTDILKKIQPVKTAGRQLFKTPSYKDVVKKKELLALSDLEDEIKRKEQFYEELVLFLQENDQLKSVEEEIRKNLVFSSSQRTIRTERIEINHKPGEILFKLECQFHFEYGKKTIQKDPQEDALMCEEYFIYIKNVCGIFYNQKLIGEGIKEEERIELDIRHSVSDLIKLALAEAKLWVNKQRIERLSF